jgi:16S rRNA (guanine966-N2)-methyltransferase
MTGRVIRVTGGKWRGRRLVTPEGEATRPSMDQHRANLMNVLGQDLTGERVLDLFAGSGAFAIECLSRGAARAVLVEQGRDALRAIRKNLAACAPAPGTAEVLDADCYALPRLAGPFDLVFVAPPYPHFRDDRARLDALVASFADPSRLADDGLVIVQSDAGDYDAPPPPGLAVDARKRWGRTEFTLLRRGLNENELTTEGTANDGQSGFNP